MRHPCKHLSQHTFPSSCGELLFDETVLLRNQQIFLDLICSRVMNEALKSIYSYQHSMEPPDVRNGTFHLTSCRSSSRRVFCCQTPKESEGKKLIFHFHFSHFGWIFSAGIIVFHVSVGKSSPHKPPTVRFNRAMNRQLINRKIFPLISLQKSIQRIIESLTVENLYKK